MKILSALVNAAYSLCSSAKKVFTGKKENLYINIIGKDEEEDVVTELPYEFAANVAYWQRMSQNQTQPNYFYPPTLPEHPE